MLHDHHRVVAARPGGRSGEAARVPDPPGVAGV